MNSLGDCPGTGGKGALFLRVVRGHGHTATLEYGVPAGTEVERSVYDVSGRRVKSLVHEWQAPGVQQVRWDASELSNGIFFYRLRANGEERTSKFLRYAP